ISSAAFLPVRTMLLVFHGYHLIDLLFVIRATVGLPSAAAMWSDPVSRVTIISETASAAINDFREGVGYAIILSSKCPRIYSEASSSPGNVGLSLEPGAHISITCALSSRC